MILRRKLHLLAILVTLSLTMFNHPATADESLPELVKSVQHSVVTVIGYDQKGKIQQLGSGFFFGDDGGFVTNHHVLYGAVRGNIKTSDGKQYEIKAVYASNEDADIVLARADVPRESAKGLVLNPAPPAVGERVLVIGSPLGLEQTVSDGIVSAIREAPRFGKVFQLTAPISPGSSGSPVLNMKGEVIGMATLQVKIGQNLNFAVPSEQILALNPDKGRTLSQWTMESHFSHLASEEESAKRPGSVQAPWDEDAGSLAKASEVYKEGKELFQEKEYSKALPLFREVAKKNPYFTPARMYIGICSVILGHYDEAAENFREAVRNRPDLAEAHFGLGVAYGNLKRHKEAIVALTQAIRINPSLASAYFRMGLEHAYLGDIWQSIEALKEAVRIDPDYAQAHHALGIMYLLMENLNSALNEYKVLKKLDQKLADSLFDLIYEEVPIKKPSGPEEPPKSHAIDEEAVKNTIRAYYRAVEQRKVDTAIAMYCLEKRQKIKRNRLEAIAADTAYYRIDKIEIQNLREGRADTVVYLYHKKHRDPEEYWEIKIGLIKEDGQWRLSGTPGKRVR
jgi:tetratricopeptide (TPR) repeat protein